MGAAWLRAEPRTLVDALKDAAAFDAVARENPALRSHLLRYHAVLAANARHRRLVVPARGRTPMSWMQRLRCVFDIDLRRCPRRGAALRVLVLVAITDPRAVATLLEHIDIGAARAPPIASS